MSQGPWVPRLHGPGARPRSPSPSLRCGETLLRALEGGPEIEYHLYVPKRGGRGARVLVTVHGIAEQASLHMAHLQGLAEAAGVVLVAPMFAKPGFRDYQRLGRAGSGERADHALDRVIAEIGRLTHAITGRIFLFGFSGGGQFVHRYAMAHPERVVAAVAVASGWYTFPDPGRPYPYGTRATKKLTGVRFEPEAFLRVPILVAVGDADCVRDRSLRQTESVDLQQGRTRVERAKRWVEAMAESARAHGLPPAVRLLEFPGVRHSFVECVEKGRLGEIVFADLFGRAPE